MVEFANKLDKTNTLFTGQTSSESEQSPEAISAAEPAIAMFAQFDPNKVSFQGSDVPPSLLLTAAGLTAPRPNDLTQAQIADEIHQDAFHIPDVLLPEMHPDAIAGAGTVISVSVFNAAFLPVWPAMPFRQNLRVQTTIKPEMGSEPDAQEAAAFFASLGVNKKLLDRLNRFARFAKNQVWVLVWLNAFTKTVLQVLRVLKSETEAKPIAYEDEAAQDEAEAQPAKTTKKRRILKI